MRPTHGARSVLREGVRRRLSAGLAVVAVAVLALLGIAELVKDGSFWIDEASVALSLRELSGLELFGRLEGGQSFPRFLLLAISGLVHLWGYETLVARALPHAFFLLGCAAWMWLVYRRFRDEPALVALAALLLAIPATPFVYGAMLKSYSFDALLALVPFLLRDDFYDELLGRGERSWRALLVSFPVWLSYPFAMALLARVGGWWLARALQRGEPRVSARGGAALAAGMGLFGVGLWLTDLRHTAGLSDALENFWGNCVIGAGERDALAIVDHLAVGWWSGLTEFSRGGGLPASALMGVRVALAAGFASIALALRRPPDAHWGSRSLGCAGLLAGLPLASLVAGYPICAGRLTLFALLPLLLVGLEGLALVASGLRRLPAGGIASAVLGLGLVLAVAPTSVRDARARVASPARTDLRPLLALTRERPELPILTNGCTRKLLETLPEGLEVPLLIGDPGVYEVALREGRDAWLVIAPSAHCSRGVREMRLASEEFQAFHADGADLHLYYVRFQDPHGAARKRRRH